MKLNKKVVSTRNKKNALGFRKIENRNMVQLVGGQDTVDILWYDVIPQKDGDIIEYDVNPTRG